MEQIILRESPTEFANPGEKMTTKFLILFVLNTPPKDGFTRKEMKNRDRIEAAFDHVRTFDGGDDSYDCIDLEDGDYDMLKELVRAQKWPMRSKFLYQFLESFEKI